MIDIERKAIDYANSKGYFGESPSMLRSMSYICIIDGFIEGYKRALTDSRERIKLEPWALVKYYPNPSWYTNWDFVVLCIIFWPFFLLILFCKGVYLLIRKIFGL